MSFSLSLRIMCVCIKPQKKPFKANKMQTFGINYKETETLPRNLDFMFTLNTMVVYVSMEPKSPVSLWEGLMVPVGFLSIGFHILSVLSLLSLILYIIIYVYD